MTPDPVIDGHPNLLIQPMMALLSVLMCVPAAPLLYSRFADNDALLKAPARRSLIELVTRKPGLDVKELPALLGVARTTALYHVGMLERSGHIRRLRQGRKQFAFPSNQKPAETADLASVSHPIARSIVAMLDDQGAAGLPRSKIHEVLSAIPKRTRNHMLARLVKDGVVLARDGGHLVLRRHARSGSPMASHGSTHANVGQELSLEQMSLRDLAA